VRFPELSAQDLLPGEARAEAATHLSLWQRALHAPAPPGGTAWHYTDAHGLMGVLSTHQLWATASLALNDTSEVTYGFDIIRRLWINTDKAELSEPCVEFVQEVLQYDFEEFAADGLFVVSASRNGDLLSQWRNYAGTDGFAIQLDMNVPLSVVVPELDPATETGSIDELRVLFAPKEESLAPIVAPQWALVEYTISRQHQLGIEVLRQLVAIALEASLLGESPTRSVVMTARSLVLNTAALLKHPAFRDEREVRFLCSKAFVGDVEEYRVREGKLVPYVRVAANLDGDNLWTSDGSEPLPIKAVRYGPNTELRGVRVAASLLERRGYKKVKIDRSLIPVAD
jgi:hypothetical protein